jgi:TonB family protein
LGRFQGDVVLDLTVGADGSVSDAKVKSGPPVLAKAALDAVRQWKYAASSQLPATTSVVVQFRLERPLPYDFEHGSNHYPDTMLFVNGDGPYPSAFYPEEAKLQHIQGKVALEVTINDDGQVSDYHVLKSDHGLLTEASLRLLNAPPCPAQNLLQSAQLRCRSIGLTPGLETVVVDFSLDRPKRLFSSGGPLPVAGYLTQAPADLLVMHYEHALYPEEARKNRLEGDVQIQLEVDGEGEVTDTAILSGPEPLQDVALEAAKKWRFTPPSEAPVEVIVTYHFWIPN